MVDTSLRTPILISALLIASAAPAFAADE